MNFHHRRAKWQKFRESQVTISDAYPIGRDPTETSDIRRRFWREMQRRWRKVEVLTRDAVVTYDLLGLGKPQLGDKLLTFQKWLDETMRQLVVGDGRWMVPYLVEARGKAERRANGLVLDFDPDQPRDNRGRWTDTGAFKEWFGKSKAVDENGKPLVVYHGSPGHYGEQEGVEIFETPSFFTENADRANWYAQGYHRTAPPAEPASLIQPVYLSIKNPLVIRTKISQTLPTVEEKQIRAAKLRGHDGIIYKYADDTFGEKTRAFVVFFPEQVKSAIGNKGTFDPKSKKITDAAPDWFQVLATSALAELQGVVEAVSQQAVRSVSNALISHRRIPRAANDVVAVMRKVGEGRSKMVADHIVVKTFGVATIEAFRARGISRVGLVPERVPSVRLADAGFDPDEPRDDRGQWTRRGGSVVAWHGTVEKYLSSIEKIGLETNVSEHNFAKKYYKGRRGESIYVTSDRSEAADFAKLAVMMLAGTVKKSNPVVLEIHIPKSELAKLRKDSKSEDTSYTFPKRIPPAWIKNAYLLKDKGSKDEWKKLKFHDADEDYELFYALVFVDDGLSQVADAARKVPQKRHGRTGRFIPFATPLSRRKQKKAEEAYKTLAEHLGEVNVLTAEDDRVCPVCERISEDGPYDLDHALSLVPAHINCRCIFIPLGPLPMEDKYEESKHPRDPDGKWTRGGETYHVFHTSNVPIDEIGRTPMWFSLHHQHAGAWHRNAIQEHGQSHTYGAELQGKVAHYENPSVQELLRNNGVDPISYASTLASNPTSKEVQDHPGTKILEKHGYHGFIHIDYDPRDFDEDADSMVIFNPSKSVKNFKKEEIFRDAGYEESKHPRDPDGKWTEIGAAQRKTHVPRIPPAWTDVRVNKDPDADLLVVGTDSKGRSQAIYSDAHWAGQAKAKFARTEELAKKYDSIERQNEAARKSGDPKVAAAADATKLIMETGIRPGSDKDTRAEKQAYGASTLEGRHVRVAKDGSMRLQFVGKKGVDVDIPVDGKSTRSMLRTRKSEAGDRGRLFPDLSGADLLAHVHSFNGGGFKTKDFRTLVANRLAMEAVSRAPTPASESAYKKAVRAVAKIVSEKLGNTPTVALQSYINPAVFARWRMEHA